jgi:putative transposase
MTVLRRTYKFLLRPTGQQAAALTTMLASHRELYNAALEERREAWRRCGVSITFAQQSAQLPEIRRVRPDVRIWSAASQQATLGRLDRAFAAFFRRVKAGQNPGYPRFKGAGWFNSVTWKQDGDGCRWLPDEHRVHLHGVGQVKVHAHRPVNGQVKTVTVKREGRRWYLVLSCDQVPATPFSPTGRDVGIDLGIAVFIGTSDGRLIANPRYLAVSADRLAVAQRALACKQRGSHRREKARLRVAALHRKVRDQRRDHHHKVALALVRDYDLIVHERLAPGRMSRSARGAIDGPGQNVAAKAGLNRSILDAGWGSFLAILAHKAESAGRQRIAVAPRNTSRTCPKCGHVAADNRLTRTTFRCRRCGHFAHADVVGALNVLRAGLARREAAA